MVEIAAKKAFVPVTMSVIGAFAERNRHVLSPRAEFLLYFHAHPGVAPKREIKARLAEVWG